MLPIIPLEELRRRCGVASLEEQTPLQRAFSPLPAPDGTLVLDPDFTLPTTAGDLPWRLFYFSDAADLQGPFGYGRRASWPLRLCAETDATTNRTLVQVEREDGRQVIYFEDGAGAGFNSWTPRVFDSLERQGDGSWKETRFETGAEFHFPAGAYVSLSYFRTVHERRVTFTYDGAQRLSQIVEPAGRLIRYRYNPDGRVQAVEDWAGRIHTFSYSGAGEVSEVVDPAGAITRYAYDSKQRLIRITG